MSRIYLVRHGQAGTRDSYDSLSALGRRQARLLGEYFVCEKLCFAAAYSGALVRQWETAQEVRAVYLESSAPFPDITQEPGWNEFDLAHVYAALAPLLSAEDPEFARQYAELEAQVRAGAENPESGVHRRWLPCDVQVVRAWMSGRHPYEGESWQAFRERVTACPVQIGAGAQEENIVVFTSATPIGIWSALAMDVHDQRAMRLAGVLYNASCTTLRLQGPDLRLHSFNAVPHLGPDLRTYR